MHDDLRNSCQREIESPSWTTTSMSSVRRNHAGTALLQEKSTLAVVTLLLLSLSLHLTALSMPWHAQESEYASFTLAPTTLNRDPAVEQQV